VGVQQYAIAGTYREFMAWRREDLEGRGGVIYLTAERAAQHTEPGVFHRIGTWQESPALEAAERLEAK
jgi:hypothetical protein